ncbi:MAG: alcohol dehydrogenase catalytic domain-containing protein [bacterium]
MRALVYDDFAAPPQVRAVPDPECPSGGAVIAVRSTGLCRSDWHGWVGHDHDITPPHIPGHELAGELVAVGPRVTGWTIGTRVTVPFVCACGQCPTCRRGEGQVCDVQFQPGFTAPGSFAEFVAIDHAAVNLVRIPDEVGDDAAAALGCRFATAYRAVTHHGRPAPGQWVAVHGSGGVGLSVIMIAVAADARVVAVDVSPAARELARELGAEVTLDGADPGVAEQIRAITGGGAAVSLDAFGSAGTCAASVRSLRKRGRHVQIGLLLGADSAPPVPMAEVISRELELYGSHGLAAVDYPALLTELTTGRLQPDRLIRRHLTLDEAGPALVELGTPDGAGPGVTMIHP